MSSVASRLPDLVFVTKTAAYQGEVRKLSRQQQHLLAEGGAVLCEERELTNLCAGELDVTPQQLISSWQLMAHEEVMQMAVM
mmetsp:Transcript_71569/g.171130  ORF Transcript_71569/g.171130 Transcript_71569/m.171130 type:complete len:82 (-) Transcript_71569:33-278(-)